MIGTHVHPAVPQARQPVPKATGVDYLGLVAAAHDEALAGPISYRDVPFGGSHDACDDDGDDGLVGARR